MEAAVCKGPHKIVIKDVEEPILGDDEVLVRVKSVGICRSDVSAYVGADPEVTYPVILGHEFSGELAAIGGSVKDFEVGDEVVAEPLFPCGKCRACLAGDYNLCGKLIMLGRQIPGALAEYAIARSSLVYHKDRSLSFGESALIEPLAVAVHAIKRASVNIGDTVIILGAGSIGLLTLQVAKRAGAEVLITDTIPDRLHLAADLGADYALNSQTSDPRELVMAMTDDTGVDIVMECTGALKCLIQAVDLVRKGGTIVTVGWSPMPEVTNEIRHFIESAFFTKINANEINLLGSSTYCRDFPVAIELASSRSVNLNSIISGRFELSQVGEVLEKLAENHPDIVKAVVEFPPTR